MKIVDAENLIVGRMATKIAKRLIEGESISVVNAEKAVLSGKKSVLIKKLKERLDIAPKGNPMKGPKFSRMPHLIVKNAIKGMVPGKSKRGKEAIKRLRVFIGVPESLAEKKEEFETIETAKNRLRTNYQYVGEISKAFGVE
jgi:large subunit ribosomal protein L13